MHDTVRVRFIPEAGIGLCLMDAGTALGLVREPQNWRAARKTYLCRWGGLRTRIAMLDSTLACELPTSPKLASVVET